MNMYVNMKVMQHTHHAICVSVRASVEELSYGAGIDKHSCSGRWSLSWALSRFHHFSPMHHQSPVSTCRPGCCYIISRVLLSFVPLLCSFRAAAAVWPAWRRLVMAMVVSMSILQRSVVVIVGSLSLPLFTHQGPVSTCRLGCCYKLCVQQ